ncbi:MAG: hypothetical protein ABF990_08975 [Acetobacter sp.]|jgi:hypothetical protein|uniref:AbiU2 domain-containing protein n=1 Tax=Acetobacter TaxID=434 RepID=UPI0037702F11
MINQIDIEIEKIRNKELSVFARTINDAMKSWETYKVLQKSSMFFQSVFDRSSALHAYNNIQYSLIINTWMSLFKLWDKRTRGKENVVFSRIYTLIKPNTFLLHVSQIYKNDNIIEKYRINIDFFIRKYDKYTNGERKNLYKEFEGIRNEFIAHAGPDGLLTYEHTLNDLDEFYQDSIKMIESVYIIFNNFISFNDICHSYQKQAEKLVDILRQSTT